MGGPRGETKLHPARVIIVTFEDRCQALTLDR
jgi:hypothetical protein